MARTEIVSYSEIDAFRQCPLKWYLSYSRRWVAPKTGPALQRGTLWHQVLEIHYRKLMAVQQWLKAEGMAPKIGGSAISARWDYGRYQGGIDQLVTDIWSSIAPLLADESGEQNEHQGIIEWMYRGYLAQWGLNPTWTILAVEHSPEIWLPTLQGGRSRFKLKMKLDLVILENVTNQTWVVDHKTGKQAPNAMMLDIDDQFGLYTWGLRKLGRPVLGAIHSYAKTEKLKRVQTLDERFVHHPLHRGEKELDAIARDAYLTARASRRLLADKQDGDALAIYSGPDPRQCGWKCDYTEPHLQARKGFVDLEEYLNDTGFVRSMGVRH